PRDVKVCPTKRLSVKKLRGARGPYRNRVLGHGATRENLFYQESAEALLAGLDAAWAAGAFLPADRELVWGDSVERRAKGKRRARVLSLMGLASEATDDPDVPEEVKP